MYSVVRGERLGGRGGGRGAGEEGVGGGGGGERGGGGGMGGSKGPIHLEMLSNICLGSLNFVCNYLLKGGLFRKPSVLVFGDDFQGRN